MQSIECLLAFLAKTRKKIKWFLGGPLRQGWLILGEIQIRLIQKWWEQIICPFLIDVSLIQLIPLSRRICWWLLAARHRLRPTWWSWPSWFLRIWCTRYLLTCVRIEWNICLVSELLGKHQDLLRRVRGVRVPRHGSTCFWLKILSGTSLWSLLLSKLPVVRQWLTLIIFVSYSRNLQMSLAVATVCPVATTKWLKIIRHILCAKIFLPVSAICTWSWSINWNFIPIGIRIKFVFCRKNLILALPFPLIL